MSAVPPESPRASAEPTEPASDRSGGPAATAPAGTDFGPNEWLVDELYQRYLADPSSVAMEWWNFFADYQPPPGSPAPSAAATRRPAEPALPAPGPPAPQPAGRAAAAPAAAA